jgi:hypothetical protein
MATAGELIGLFVGADHSVIYSDADDPPTDMAGWTVVLDIRKRDTSASALLSATGVVSGTYSATVASNTQIVTFTLTDEDLAAAIFTGNEWHGRHSIKRTDTGFEQPLRYGDVTITRVTQV